MKDSQILSAFADLPAAPAVARAGAGAELVQAWDACQLGTVLRTVLIVQAAAGVAAMFGTQSVLAWVDRLALITGGSLPATLVWLLLACQIKNRMARLPLVGQWVAGAVLGALTGLLGCALLAWLGLVAPAPWWGSAAAGVFLSSTVLAVGMWRAKAALPAATQARLAELQSRIRPHFLFNTLNSAIALVRAEPARAEALLEDLSELFRHALSDTQAAVPLSQELELARRYLAIEQVRFGDRLQVEWQTDPSADAARLPPLILQPLVENAVKHGVEPSAAGAQLRISTQRRGTVVVVKVTNTVPSGAGVAGHGLALDNVRQRLALLHDVQGQFRSSLVDGVFQVRLELPL